MNLTLTIYTLYSNFLSRLTLKPRGFNSCRFCSWSHSCFWKCYCIPVTTWSNIIHLNGSLNCHKIQKGDLRQPGRQNVDSVYSFVVQFWRRSTLLEQTGISTLPELGQLLSTFFFFSSWRHYLKKVYWHWFNLSVSIVAGMDGFSVELLTSFQS